jgi:hypothetical protein
MYNRHNFIVYGDFLKIKPLKTGKQNLKFSYKSSLINGDILEFGVYKGTSINLLASLHPTTVYGFDSFEGLPEEWNSVNGTLMKSGHFALDKLPDVKENVKLIKGWFNETLPVFLKENKLGNIRLLHIDCDLFSSAFTVLDLLNSKIVKGTVIVFDELANWRDENLFKNYQQEEWLALKNWTEKYDRGFSILSRSPSCQATILIEK